MAPDLVGREPLLARRVPSLELVGVEEPPQVVLEPLARHPVEGPQERLDAVVQIVSEMLV